MADVSITRQGMITDMNALNMQGTQYSYALNASIESNDEGGNFTSIQNDGSNYLAINFPTGFQVIGRVSVREQNRTIFFLVNPTTGDSQIGEVLDCNFNDDTDDVEGVTGCADCDYPVQKEDTPLEKITQTPYCDYSVIIEGDCLNFSLDFPIRSTYKITDCSFNLYFTDNNNQRRYVYFTYDSDNHLVLADEFKVLTGYEDDECKVPIYSDELDCNKIAFHPIHASPCLEVVEVVSGGSLRAGVYQFLMSYSDKSGNPLSHYMPATHPLPIYTKEITFDTNYVTDRAISLKLENVADNVYSYFTLVVAETIDNFTNFKVVGTYPSTQRSIIYTGNEENLQKLTPEDVFFRNPFYNTAGNITDSNDFLFFSELQEFPKPNLQRAANRVKLYWQTVAIPEAVYKDPINTYRYKSFNRDEVYPMGLMFITENGEEFGPYHIPAPSKETFLDDYSIDVEEIISNDDVIDRDICEDVNCCEDSELETRQGSISVSCSDNDCTSQGSVSLTFTFPDPLPYDVTFHIGAVVEYVLYPMPTFVGVGSDIFTFPAGVTPWTYYSDMGTNVPFEVTVPAGSTSYTVNEPIYQIGNTAFLNEPWVCHSCIFPIRDLYIKAASPSTVNFELTNDDGITIHSVDNPPPEPDEDCVDCSENAENKRWQVYNTGFVIDSPHEVVDKCDDDSIWEWGHFAYWESIEKYPNDPDKWGDLCGKPIRHHKFPDSLITHIHDGLSGNKSFEENNIVFPIGVLIDHQSVKDAIAYCVTNGIISAADAARIKEYRLIRGNRVGNESIVAKGLLYDMWSYDKNNNTYYYPNYPYNDLNKDYFIAPTKSTYNGSNTSDPIPSFFNKTSRYTFHSPNVHFVNKAIGTELKLETLEYGKSEGFFNHSEEQAKYRFLSAFARTLAFGAGLAVAFSSEKDKECKQITIKGETAATVSVPPSVTETVGTLQAITGGATWGYDRWNGIAIPTRANPLASEVTYNTCKGTPLQTLSPIPDPDNLTSKIPAWVTGAVVFPFYLLIIALRETEIFINLFKSLLPKKNFGIQYNSVGKYSNYLNVANSGNKIRSIQRSAYLEPRVQIVNEVINASTNSFSTVRINNWNRERSVYLKISNAKPFPNPSVVDNSRGTINQFFSSLSAADRYSKSLNERVIKNISSYYASIKNYVPDQYGRISDIEYLETDNCSFSLAETYPLNHMTVFGGDTFINRFALKRKMPFFLQTRFKATDEGDVQYDMLGNAGYPNYYFNTDKPFFERLSEVSINIGTLLSDLGNLYTQFIGVNESRLDAKTTKAFYQNGYIHLYNYGIPYFFAESDINVDYRHGENTAEKAFYPNQSDLENWLQEKNVPITEDNYYIYNKTYSKQNKESVIGIEPDSLDDVKECRIDHSQRVIYSDRGNNDGRVDEWRRFKGNNFWDFPVANGRIISIDGIENDKVLVRFENTSQIFGAYSTLQLDSGTVAVGNAGMFQTPPKEFSHTILGFAGSQHVEMLKTEFGHVWVDAKRGQVFSLAPNASGLDELSKYGMRNWFKENLPFQILKDFPQLASRDADNNFKGIGIALSFDKRFGRLFLTKLDYKLKNRDVTYDTATKKFMLDEEEVSLTDSTYFCNRSFTASYNFLTKSWVSFHSFIPNYYIDQIDFNQSGINGGISSLWSHNVSNKSYQVYYGNLYPFTIEVLGNPALQHTTIESVEFETQALRYHNMYDVAVKPNVTFNKAIVYNDRQCSPPLSFAVRDENNIYQSLQYPRVQGNEYQVLLSNKDGKWRFNQFFDAVNLQGANVPFFINKCSNADKVPNLKALNFFKPDTKQPMIRGKQVKVRLTNDIYSNYKLIFDFMSYKKGASVS